MALQLRGRVARTSALDLWRHHPQVSVRHFEARSLTFYRRVEVVFVAHRFPLPQTYDV